MDDVLRDIASTIARGKAVVFCGAGISKDSGLPLATELQEYILHWIVRLDDESKTRIEQEFKSDLSRTIQSQLQRNEMCRKLLSLGLPFELFFEVLSAVGDIRKLLLIFNAGEPNLNHVTLAQLVKQGYLRTISTTNFDVLLEQALLNEGLVRDKDFEVFARTGEVEQIDWNSSRARIVKLHGTCEDFESIGITLKNVSERALGSSRQVAVDHVFSNGPHEMVLVLGYSCSDHFDITPQIRASSKTSKRIVLVNHASGSDYKLCSNTGTLFEHFSNVTILQCDTSRVIDAIWANVLRRTIPRPTIGEPSWRFRVMDWYESNLSRFGEEHCLAFVGLLLLHASRFQESLPYLRQLTFDGHTKIRPNYLANMGSCFEALGHYAKAIQFIELAIEASTMVDDRAFAARALANLGRVYTRAGNCEQALNCYSRGLNIARDLGHATTECEHLCNFMVTLVAMGEYDKALAHGPEALRIARDAGYKHAEGRVLNELGNVYFSMHVNNEALQNYKAAREIAIQLGDQEGHANALANVANVYGRCGEYAQSISLNQSALAIARQINDRLGEATRLFNIGNSLFRLHELEQAKTYFEDALLVAKEFLDEKHPIVWQSRLMGLQMARLLGLEPSDAGDQLKDEGT